MSDPHDHRMQREHVQVFRPRGEEITLADGRKVIIYDLYVKDGKLYGSVDIGNSYIEVEFIASEAVYRPHEG